jgi:hypothetical protein
MYDVATQKAAGPDLYLIASMLKQQWQSDSRIAEYIVGYRLRIAIYA